MKFFQRFRRPCFLLVSCAWAQPVIRLKARRGGRAGLPGRRPGRDAPPTSCCNSPPSPGRRSPGIGAARHAGAAIRAGCRPDGGLPGRRRIWRGWACCRRRRWSHPTKSARCWPDQVAGPLLVVFHPDVEMAAAREAVRALGFDVLENPSLLAGQLVVVGRAQRAWGAGRVRRCGLHPARIRRTGGGDSAGGLRRSGDRGRTGGRVRAGEPAAGRRMPPAMWRCTTSSAP